MSNGNIEQFKELIKGLLESINTVIRVDSMHVDVDRPIYIGKLVGGGGTIELLFGPSEYHVELFITLGASEERYNLARLISVQGVREWMENNRLKVTQDNLAGEFEWIENLLLYGLRYKEEFATLYR